jgi:phospholipid transport system substrate-binding protein
MPSNAVFPRRGFLALSLAGLTVALGGSPALAMTDKDAAALIQSAVDDINKVINSGKAETAMYTEFERIFTKYGDVPIIARSSLGVAWRSASASQQAAYTKAFSGYMARKYGKRFREFIGGKIVVTGTKKVSSGFLVTSMAHLKGSAPFVVEWQVSDKSGQGKMFNLYIEGISLLATERTEISAMLDKRGGDLDRLIADLRTTS